MGFGKYLLGGVCAAGAVIAAPLAAPAALIGLAGTGAAGLVAGAAGAAGAGMAVSAKGAYEEGCKKGYEKAAAEFEQKYRKQYEAFMKKEKNFQKDKEEYETLIKEYEKYIDYLSVQLSEEKESAAKLKEKIGERAIELAKLRKLSNVR